MNQGKRLSLLWRPEADQNPAHASQSRWNWSNLSHQSRSKLATAGQCSAAAGQYSAAAEAGQNPAEAEFWKGASTIIAS